MIWNNNIGMTNNHYHQDKTYQQPILNPVIMQLNHQQQPQGQSIVVIYPQDQPQNVKQQNSTPKIQFVNPVLQEDLKFSSSENSSSEQNSSEERTKKINKKNDKIPSHAAYKKYSRITPQIKQQLIHLIARQNMSIKDASVKLKINYSSAKFIFSRYRDRKLQIIDQQLEKDNIPKEHIVLRKINPYFQNTETNQLINRILVKCSSGGKFEAQNEKLFTLRQIYQMYQDYPPTNNQLQKLEY